MANMLIAFFCFFCCVFAQIPAANGNGYVASNLTFSTSEVLTATKGDNVSLFWSYQVNSSAEFVHLVYGCKDTATNQTMQLATKNATTNSILVLNVSSFGISNAFEARLSIHDSQLVINNAQYNDSMFTYHAIIKYKVNQVIYEEFLQPVVQLTVQGIPAFLSPELTSITIAENTTLTVKHMMEGNPLPALLTRWFHEAWTAYNDGILLYPFIAEAIFNFERIDRSYCGRTVHFRAMNFKASSDWRGTTVQVSFMPNGPTNITAVRKADCVIVNWIKEETGLCSLNYTVHFNAENDVMYQKTFTGKQQISQCGIPLNYNITSVSVTAATAAGNATVSKSVTFLTGGAYGPTTSKFLWLIPCFIITLVIN